MINSHHLLGGQGKSLVENGESGADGLRVSPTFTSYWLCDPGQSTSLSRSLLIFEMGVVREPISWGHCEGEMEPCKVLRIAHSAM